MQDLGGILRKLGTRNTSGDRPPDDPLDGPEPCPRCGGRGWLTADVPVGHPDFGQVITCECQQRDMQADEHDRLLRYSNLGELARFTFELLKPDGLSNDADSVKKFRNAYREAEEFCAHPQGWLTITGPHGTGKTHMAAAIGNRLIDKGHVVFFAHVPDLLDHLRGTFGPSSDVAYSDLFEQVRTAPLLILDGLGSHSTTPWAEEKLRQIINHRYNAELPTVVTTANSLDDMDELIVSRLRAPGLGRILELRSTTPEQASRVGHIEPQMLKRMTFDTFDARGNNPNAGQRASLEAALSAAKNFAADPDGWLTLSGNTGVGKTHLAVAVAAERLATGAPVMFAFVPELMDYLRYTFGPESPVTYDRVFEQVKNTSLLILDDLGKEQSSKWAVEKLYQIIVHRHNARLPTVITSMMEFSDDLDPITSRIQDPSVSQLIRLDAPDYRNKQRRPAAQQRRGTRARPAG
jgi:DNA replication protein DnaC